MAKLKTKKIEINNDKTNPSPKVKAEIKMSEAMVIRKSIGKLFEKYRGINVKMIADKINTETKLKVKTGAIRRELRKIQRAAFQKLLNKSYGKAKVYFKNIETMESAKKSDKVFKNIISALTIV